MNTLIWILLSETLILALVIILLIILIWILLGKKVVVPSVTVKVEKNEYARGDTVNISGVVMENGKPFPDAMVKVKITDPAGEETALDDITADEEGAFAAEFEVPEASPGGTYTVTATALGTTATTSFTQK